MDAFEANASDDILGDEALGRGCINIRLRIQELEDINSSTAGRRDIGDKREDVSGLDGTEGGALIKRDLIRDQFSAKVDSLTITDTKKLNIGNSSRETNREPYQKIKEMTKKPID